MKLGRIVFSPSNMESGLCLYKKKYQQHVEIWSYLSFDDKLKIIIALASMTCIANLDAYELYLGDKKVFNYFIDEC